MKLLGVGPILTSIATAFMQRAGMGCAFSQDEPRGGQRLHEPPDLLQSISERKNSEELRSPHGKSYQAESKKRKSSEANSGSIRPYGRHGSAVNWENHIYHSNSLACQGHFREEGRYSKGRHFDFPGSKPRKVLRKFGENSERFSDLRPNSHSPV